MKTKIVMICMLLLSGYAQAQMMINSEYCEFNERRRCYTFTRDVSLSQIEDNDKRVLNLPGNITLTRKSRHTDPTETTHHCFVQEVNGVPILNSEVSFRERKGLIISATGMINVGAPSNPGVMPAEEILASLFAKLGCKKYKWQDEELENSLKERKENPAATYYPQVELKIMKLDQNIFNSQENYKYCYVAKISAIYSEEDSVYRDSVYYLDAVSGSIIKSFSPVLACFDHTSDPQKNEVASTSASLAAPAMPVCNASCLTTNVPLNYYGSHDINTAQFLYTAVACSHRLKDNCTGTTLYVQYKEANSGNDKDYRDNANTWTNTNLFYPDDIDGASTLWSLEMTHDFFRNVLQRNSYDDAYSQIFARTMTQSWARTGWNQIDNEMEIAKSSNAYESTIDIIGHEIGHGVADQVCYLSQDASVGANSEEGVLAEGYGDIFGQAAEHYVNMHYSTNGAGIDDYRQGVTCAIGGLTYQKQRFMDSPKTNGHPDTYHGTNWLSPATTATDAFHRNSTVIGFWYYILSEGKTGQNDNFDDYCVTGIGQDKAIKITYNSLFNLVGTAKDFAAAREETIQAAIDLYTDGSDEVMQTTNAWYAVGVGPAYSGRRNFTGHTASGTESYGPNSAVLLQNFNVQAPGGNVSVTSPVEIAMLADVNIENGSLYSAVIVPGLSCNGMKVAYPHPSVYRPDGSQSASKTAFKTQTISDPQTKAEASKMFDFTVVPNPSNGMFVLSLNQSLAFPKSVTVIDIMGKVVAEKNNPSSYELNFNLGDAAKGVYIIKVNYEDSSVAKRVVKNQ